MTFDKFNFVDTLQEGLDAMGFDKPTPIQQEAIPAIMDGKDLIATAQTGTGKTAAFILPILHKIAKSGSSDINTLILAPTRELAIQIDQQIQGFAYFLGISSIAVYGGGDGVVWEQQKRALETGAEIVVATPGRLIALLASGKIKFNNLQHLILDEADRMMDMGFSEDLLKIVTYLPKNRQTVLFSATMPAKIRQFSSKILTDPISISIALGKTAKGITQSVYHVHDNQKEGLVKHILSQKAYEAVIIFASTKDKVKSLYKVLKKEFEVEAFHSDLEQVEREKIMSAFKNRAIKILIGTDIISRGIDVVGIELVINYDTPSDPEDYVHRVGRTARADSQGEAITFVNPKDRYKFNNIEKLIGLELEQQVLPEHLGEAPKVDDRSEGTSRSSGNKKKGGNKKFSKPRNNQSRPPRKDGESKPKPKAENNSSEAKGTPKTVSSQHSKFRTRKNVNSETE
ncbi:DEAD/DEAH box helicase [Litoribacter ruber]|uniref:DEAD/DEAH box helicase n=1 Tax=Litoribacter ruber TaxID=702568 RepID=UPI001BDAA1B1|nr:DEAD/DEAH box helicase [Litoribacter ruber]MBT0810228.1 DEAD/DEAH box helicase [Litoribacter ruber]